MLKEIIKETFEESGWKAAHCWVRYSAISKRVSEKLMEKGQRLKRAATIERVVRMLAQEVLESDRRGSFRWRQN